VEIKTLPTISCPGQLIARTLTGGSIALPGQQEIYLASFWVAGSYHYRAMAAIAELGDGQKLRLQREPLNPHDRNAIEIYSESWLKIGYVPRNTNYIPARLMDAGKHLYLRVKHYEVHPQGVCSVRVRMYMENI